MKRTVTPYGVTITSSDKRECVAMMMTRRSIVRQSAPILVSFCCATAVCAVSNNLHPRVVHRDETVAQQIALLHREALVFDSQPGDLPEFRNRVLFPAMMQATSHVTGLNSRQAFLGLRWLTAFVCFYIMWLFSVRVARAGGGARIPCHVGRRSSGDGFGALVQSSVGASNRLSRCDSDDHGRLGSDTTPVRRCRLPGDRGRRQSRVRGFCRHHLDRNHLGRSR